MLGGIAASIVWCGLWIAAGVRAEAHRDAGVLGGWLAGFVAGSCLVLLVVLPAAGAEIGAAGRWIHHAAFAALGGFLFAAEFLRAVVRRQTRRGEAEAARVAIRRLWWLTELAPGPAAIALALSGLRLIYESQGACSVRDGWLFWVVAAFGFFFADGLCFYLPQVRRWQRQGRRSDERRTEIQLTLHAVSFPVVFAIAASRWAAPHPLRGACAWVESALAFFPSPWPEVLAAAGVIGAIAGIVAFVRLGERAPNVD